MAKLVELHQGIFKHLKVVNLCTNSFFAGPCAEFLRAIQHLNKVLQYDNISTDGVIQKLATTNERLEITYSSITLQFLRQLIAWVMISPTRERLLKYHMGMPASLL